MNRWPYASPYLQDIDEAEGSYGLTPKAHLSFSALARERNKDKRTKGGDVAASHARRTDPRPTSSDQGRKRRFMTQSDRNMYRAADETDSYDYNPEEAGEPSGPGGKPKGKKLARQIARGVSEESFDLYDLVLSHLLDEGYADTYEAAEAIMVNMSEEWRESICEEYDMYEERKDLPVSRMSKQARRKAFRLGNEINDPESGIGLNVKSDPTAKQLRNMSRVGGKKVKHHIKKGYEQGSLYEPDNVELNWKRTHR